MFIDRVSDGRTWRDAMESWNIEHPELPQYDNWRRFSADCRDSFTRITGTPLFWGAEEPEGNSPQ